MHLNVRMQNGKWMGGRSSDPEHEVQICIGRKWNELEREGTVDQSMYCAEHETSNGMWMSSMHAGTHESWQVGKLKFSVDRKDMLQ